MEQILTFNLPDMSHATSTYRVTSSKDARYRLDRPDLVCSLSYGEQNVKNVLLYYSTKCPT